jgi:hypothetical protein
MAGSRRDLARAGRLRGLDPDHPLEHWPPQLRDLGSASGLSLRVFVDGKTWQAVREVRKTNPRLSKWCSDHRGVLEAAASRRGKAY